GPPRVRPPSEVAPPHGIHEPRSRSRGAPGWPSPGSGTGTGFGRIRTTASVLRPRDGANSLRESAQVRPLRGGPREAPRGAVAFPLPARRGPREGPVRTTARG